MTFFPKGVFGRLKNTNSIVVSAIEIWNFTSIICVPGHRFCSRNSSSNAYLHNCSIFTSSDIYCSVSVSAFYRAINYMARCTFHNTGMKCSVRFVKWPLLLWFVLSKIPLRVRLWDTHLVLLLFLLSLEECLFKLSFFGGSCHQTQFSVVFAMQDRLQSEIQGDAKFWNR